MEKNYNAEMDFILEELIKEYENINKGVRFYSEEDLLSTNQKISQSVSEKFGLQDWEINVLYYTLLVDKYIKSIDPLTISLEGLVFRNNGGYIKRAISEGREAARLESIQNDFRKYSFGLMIFTAIVAVGTLISAWFFAIEIYKYYVH